MIKIKNITNPNQLQKNQYTISQGTDDNTYKPNITNKENETLRNLLQHFINYGFISNFDKPLLKTLLDKSHCIVVWNSYSLTPYFFELETDYNTQKNNNDYLFA